MACNTITDISVSNCRLSFYNSDNELVVQFLLANTTYTLFTDRIFIRDTEASWQLYATAFPIGGLTTMQDLVDLIDASIASCPSGGGGGGSYYLYSENYDSGTFAPSTVTGLNAVSIGVANDASGDNSTAFGSGNTASGDIAISFGYNNFAQNRYSTAFGSGTQANGQSSTAFGSGTQAIGNYSTSFGGTTLANSDYSTAFGNSTQANGQSSTAFGELTTAKSFLEIALGIQNTDYTPNSANAFDSTDRLLVVGNGNGSNSDAFTVLKNAKVGIDIDNFETTTSDAKLQVNGYINAVLNVYANHAAADADTDLKTNDFYKLTADRTVYQKP